jgi:hypothetical protein
MDEQGYTLEKSVWTTEDFDVMGWHDSKVHAFGMPVDQFELCLDIDYILKWVDPVPPTKPFTFWVAPATLVFENVMDFKLEMDTISPTFDILSLKRSDETLSPNGRLRLWRWEIDGVGGNIGFQSSGYTQYFRRRPLHIASQVLTYDERGGLTFDRKLSL